MTAHATEAARNLSRARCVGEYEWSPALMPANAEPQNTTVMSAAAAPGSVRKVAVSNARLYEIRVAGIDCPQEISGGNDHLQS
jgi:hypothetical protein